MRYFPSTTRVEPDGGSCGICDTRGTLTRYRGHSTQTVRPPVEQCMQPTRFRLATFQALTLLLGLLTLGCDDAAHARSVILTDHAPRIQALVREDAERTVQGTRIAAETLSRGFAVEDPARRANEMRFALRRLTQLPHGIPELTISPITFVAVVGMDGIVICRDSENESDPMMGLNVGELFPHVHRAITNGEETRALVDWPGGAGAPTVVIDVQATPIRRDGQQLGVILAGTPLWRTAQKLTRQLQSDTAGQGSIVWVYLYRGDTLYHRGTPENLDAVTPNAADRAVGFGRSPGGYTGEMLQYGRWFGFGVVPLPSIGEDVGFIVWRSDPV